MIIQAGFDFEILAQPHLLCDGGTTDKLVLIEADRDLEPVSVRVVSEEFDGSLKPHIDAIVERLDPEETRFFGIAHAGDIAPWGYVDKDLDADSEALRKLADSRGFRLLAHLVFTADSWISLYGNSYFELYGDRYADLPSTMREWKRSPSGGDG
ncbi:hypothetical protein [Specibacter cremeus]|uniref:hypothetical protein n=1 Tax=Specibacter cremeus TaxID=1629051 RepID=UPI000F792A5C|nr:hypothetical protein [Specibacter cremeus]